MSVTKGFSKVKIFQNILLPLIVLLVLYFTYLGLSQALTDPQGAARFYAYRPDSLETMLSSEVKGYPYYQGQVLKVKLDVGEALTAYGLSTADLTSVSANVYALGGPESLPLSQNSPQQYTLEYTLSNLTETGNFSVPFTASLASGGTLNLGSFGVYANKRTPQTLTDSGGTHSLEFQPDFPTISDFTAVSSVYCTVPDIGRIAFTAPVNLVTGGFMDDLGKLDEGIHLGTPGLAGLRTSLLPGLNAPAGIEMYNINLAEGITTPKIVQLDEAGQPVQPENDGYLVNQESVTYDREMKAVSFNVSGMADFAIDPGLHVTTASHLIEGNSVVLEGYVEDLATNVFVFVYTENNLAGIPEIDPVTGHWELPLNNLPDGISPIWIKADNGATSTVWDAKPKSAKTDPLQILVNTNGLLEEGLSTADTDIVVPTPVSAGSSSKDINKKTQDRFGLYGQQQQGYWATLYYGGKPLVTGKTGSDSIFLVQSNLSNLPDGTHTFVIKGFNLEGYESNPWEFTMLKDTQPPAGEPTILEPSDNTVTDNNRPDFYGNLSLDVSGDLEDVRLYNGSAMIGVGMADLNKHSWFVRPSLPLTPNYYDQLYLVLMDHSGNESSGIPLPRLTVVLQGVRTVPK